MKAVEEDRFNRTMNRESNKAGCCGWSVTLDAAAGPVTRPGLWRPDKDYDGDRLSYLPINARAWVSARPDNAAYPLVGMSLQL